MRAFQSFLIILLFSSCIRNAELSSEEPSRKFVIQKSNFRIEGQQKNGLLVDTLSYFKNSNLILKQFWQNGILSSTVYNDNGRLRTLEHVIIENPPEFVEYYRDKLDSSFRILPYDTDLFTFYDSIKVVTNTKFKANQATVFQVLNVPQNSFAIAIVGGTAQLKNDSFIVQPTRQVGDTFKIMFWYSSFPKYGTPLKSYIIE